MTLHIIEELAAFPPTRRALCSGDTPPNAHMVALANHVLAAIVQAAAPLASPSDARLDPERALTALKAMTGVLIAWRFESTAPSSLVAALQQEQPPSFIPSLVQATVAFLGSPLLPYEVKNQAALALVLATLDSADANPAPALAQALAICFLPTPSGEAGPSSSTPLLAPIHPSLRGLPATLLPLLHHGAGAVAGAVASEARLALARAVLVATDLAALTAALPKPGLPLGYDTSVAAGGTLMGGTCMRV